LESRDLSKSNTEYLECKFKEKERETVEELDTSDTQIAKVEKVKYLGLIK